MANTIKLKQGSGSDPSASDLVLGEPAIRTDTGEIFLKKDDGSIAKVAGGIDDGDKGDITVSNDGATFTIDNDAVTYAKIQNVSATNRILGRDSSGAGVIEEITPANLRTMLNVADGATNVTNTNQLTNGAGFITATLTNEQVQDIVGGMVTGNTESGITVTYQDGDGTLDFSVASQTDNNFTNADHSKLDGIEAGATADQTASEILTLLKTVDGSGSGLDADTLDGISSGSFLRSDAADSSSEDITINGLKVGEWSGSSSYKGIFHSSQSSGEYMIISNDTHTFISATSGNNVYIRNGGNDGTNQLIIGSGNDALTWRGNKVFHAGNDGAGSGLDSDSVDGIAGSSLLRSDTADTASGDITFSGGAGAVTIAANSDIRLASGTWSGDQAGKIQHHQNIFYIQGGTSGIQLRGRDGGSMALFQNSSTILYDDVNFQGGAGAATIAANSDISFTNGNWTGNHTKIQHHNNTLYIVGGSSGIFFREGGTDRWQIDGSGHFDPKQDSTYDIGQSDLRVRKGYFDEVDSRQVLVDNGILETKAAIATSHTIATNYNALAVSPTINNGVTVTVPSGAVWAIV